MVLVFVVAVGSALLFSFLCSIFESVLLSIGHARVESLIAKNNPAGLVLRRFKQAMEQPIAAILILNTVAHTVGAALAGWSFEKAFTPNGTQMFLFTASLTVAILLFTEIVPKTLGISFHNQLAAPVAYSVHILVMVLRPVLTATSWVARLLKSGKEAPVTSAEEIRLLAALGRAEGVVRPKIAEIIEGAANLRKLRVLDVMVPRRHVQSLSMTAPWPELVEIMSNCRHSRFPVTSTGELDDLKGVVLAKEVLLAGWKDGLSREKWRSLIHQPLWVPATSTLLDVLPRFQHQRKHLGVVVNEYGGVDGIITVEDILEEVVGEIRHEREPLSHALEKHGDRHVTCRGLTEARHVFEFLDVAIDTDQVTLSGYLTEKLGRLPRVGDEIIEEGIAFRVKKASHTRAEVIECQPAPEPSSEE